MALLWLDSFDHYLTADVAEKYATVTGSPTPTISTTGGRRSSGALESTNGGRVITAALTPTPDSTAIVGMAVKVTTFSGTTAGIVTIRSGGSSQVTVAFSSTGLAQVYRGATTGTLLGTTAVAVAANVSVFVELKTVIHPSAGSIVLRFDELEVLNLTGINTAATGSAAWDRILLGNEEIATYTYLYDDLYVLDGSGAAPCNDLLGDCRVDARVPTAEGASSAWTPLSGTDNALMVDEPTPDDDTTYTSTPTVGATDTHVVQDAPVVGALLYGVQLCLSRKKSDAGTCSVAPVVRHSGTDYVGTASNPGTSYAYGVTPYGLNPGTSTAWTEADFNAAEFGYQRTA